MSGSRLERLRRKLRQVPPGVWLRLGVLVALFVAGVALVRFTPLGEYLERERMIEALDRVSGEPWAPFLLCGLYAVLTPLGVVASPLMIAGAIVFGFWRGTLYNVTGLVLGAMSAFYVGRALGRDLVERLAGEKLRRAEKVFERQGFWPLVQTRFLPVPFPLVSYAAALAGVGATQFFVTSVIGLLPATVMHTYFLSRLVRDPSPAVGVTYIAVWAGFNVVIGWPTLRQAIKRRRRYRELREEREARGIDGEND